MAVRTIRELMTRASVISVSPETSLRAAAKTMAHHRIGAIVVMDEGSLVGVFTERDLLTRVVADDVDIDETAIREVMTSSVVTLGFDASANDALRLMTQVGIRHIIVEEGGVVYGMVSLRDFVGAELQMADQRWHEQADS